MTDYDPEFPACFVPSVSEVESLLQSIQQQTHLAIFRFLETVFIPVPFRANPQLVHLYLTAVTTHHFIVVDPLPLPRDYQTTLVRFMREVLGWHSFCFEGTF